MNTMYLIQAQCKKFFSLAGEKIGKTYVKVKGGLSKISFERKNAKTNVKRVKPHHVSTDSTNSIKPVFKRIR